MRKIYVKKTLLSILVLSVISSLVFVNTGVVNANYDKPLEKSGLTGRTNWEQGVIEAIGTGVAPAGTLNPTQGRMLARRAAIVDAYRNLAEITQGVRVDSQTTIQNLAVANDTVKVQVSALIQGARIVREIPGNDGSYVVVMQMNMYGSDSLAQVVYNAIKPDRIESFPKPAANYTSIPSATPGAEYTGVIVIAQNMGLQSTFSPRLYDESGNIVYGNKYLDPDFAIKYGMVDYSKVDVAMAGSSRVGARPLVVKAIKVVDNNYNLVISNDDAQKILAAHAKSGFLSKCAVVFAR